MSKEKYPCESFVGTKVIFLIIKDSILINNLNLAIIVIHGYPIFAQQNYDNPRESTGQIVCANCHLAQKEVTMQVPQSTLANSVFEAKVTIPIDYPLQINSLGKLIPINVGGVIILPNSFIIHKYNNNTSADFVANNNNSATNIINKYNTNSADSVANNNSNNNSIVMNNIINVYSNNYPNIVVMGPLPASKYSSMTFVINSPTINNYTNNTNSADSVANNNINSINYGKHTIYFGGNRGRGQLYADGTKSNNTIYTSNINGIINKINQFKLYTDIIITPINNSSAANNNNTGLENNIIIQIPKGPAIIVNVGDVVELDQPLTTNPNVGGFGQVEKQIVLQDAKRVQIQIAFIFIITIAQICLVIKKKQYETTLLTQRY